MGAREITGKGLLLDKKGNPTVYGWARQPVLEANLDNLDFYSFPFLHDFMIKCWQYYGITTPTHFFSFAISTTGYAGHVFAYVLDFNTGEYHQQTINVPFGSGIALPQSSTRGDSHFRKGNIHFHFFAESDNERTIDVTWPGFGGSNLLASIDLRLPRGHESMVNVYPFPNKRFFYTRKVNCIPAQGVVQYSIARNKETARKTMNTYDIEPGDCFGTLDWGVGVWPYKSFWIWGSLSQRLPDGRALGLNLGGGLGSDPEVNDNAIILNGKLHKLGIVDFQYGRDKFKKPWQMKSRDGRLELEFKPFYERVSKTEAIIISSEVHQVFGRYSGFVVTDEGERIEIKDLVGWAEEHRARW